MTSPRFPGRGELRLLPHSTGLEIVELDESHLPDAARLFAEGYVRLRRTVPALPAAYLDGSAVMAPLRRMLAAGAEEPALPAVAAFRRGRLTGFMAGLSIPGLRGHGTAARVPEWAHAAVGPDRAATFAALYGICGAYTTPQARGVGLAGALLEAVEGWARELGYERIAVDFESANLLARRFWLRRFDPICLSFERHLDSRLTPPNMAVRP